MSKWYEFSTRIKEKILKPRAAGKLAPKEGMRFVVGVEGSARDGNLIYLSLLVDETDGVIADARFLTFGGVALIAAAEILCELLLRKNYDQAKRIQADLIDCGDFPKEEHESINFVLDALEVAIKQCEGIPLAEGYEVTPVDLSHLEAGEYPNWDELSHEEKIATIGHTISKEIQPYVELDEGGVEVVGLQDLALKIKYQGSCTSCYAATGSTLSAIQQILRARVHPELIVTPVL